MIHETAIVDPGASIGSDVEIGPYAIIGDGVVIGDRTRIGPHVVIKGRTRIGTENRIFQFASIGDDPQDKKYKGQVTDLVIGDRNTIRECCTLNRGTVEDRGVTRLGDDNWLMAYVHVAHDCVVGNDNVMANNCTLAGHVTVGDFAVLGGFSGAHQYCQIGSYAFLGMHSAINRDVPAYCMVSGQPAVPKGINSEGLRRRGYSSDEIRQIRRAYKTIYRSGLKLEDAILAIEERMASEPVLGLLAESLQRATRGIVR